jgi:tRNA dimethylallyltransferase
MSPEIPTSQIRVLAVVGPTAVGKTALAEELAVRLHGEMVSADSMQVYRGMDIGTAKPAAEERRVPYWCLDLAEPGEPFSAALYQRASREAIADIAARGKLPVVAGGTGLYVRAALDDWHFPAGEQAENPVRDAYSAFAEEHGAEALFAQLAERDPAAAAILHPNNVRRVVRALEMLDEGVSYADQAAGFSARESVYDARFIGLTMEREKLYERVDARVDGMLERGLLAEVERLLDAGLRDALTAAQAIGYKEFVPVIEQGADLDEAVASVKRASRRYAKRQLTWFRADPRVAWLDVTELSLSDAADAAMRTLDW